MLLHLVFLTAVLAPTPLPVVDPGFEEGLAHWSVGRVDERPLVELSTEVRHGGAQAVKLVSPDRVAMPWLAQSLTAERLASYRLSTWARGTGQGDTTAAVKIEFYNAEGANTSGHYGRLKLADEDWHEVEVEARADPDTVRAAILVRLFGEGPVWFDDVEFQQTIAAPFMSAMPERAVVTGGTTSLPIRLHLLTETAEPLPLKVSLAPLAGGEARPITAPVTVVEPQLQQAVLELPGLAPGEYRVTLQSGENSSPVSLFVPPADRQPANLTDSGTILVEGQPFFPIGAYHVGTSDFALLAEHGFNCVQAGSGGGLEAFGKLLEAAKAAGLTADVALYVDGQVGKIMDSSLAKIAAYADHPAIVDWKIIDEPDLRADVIDDVPAAYRILKEADPTHAIELTIASAASYAYWANFCDILQIDPYPLPYQPLTMVSDYTKAAKSVLLPWQNLTVVLQSGWLPGAVNQPTYPQARTMVYQSIINGAKGIFWYSYRDPGWYLPESPLWADFKALNEETAALGEIAIRGEPLTAPSLGDSKLEAAAWRYQGKVVMMVANSTREVAEATFAPPSPLAAVRARRGEAPLEFRAGRVTISLPPESAVLLEGDPQ